MNLCSKPAAAMLQQYCSAGVNEVGSHQFSLTFRCSMYTWRLILSLGAGCQSAGAAAASAFTTSHCRLGTDKLRDVDCSPYGMNSSAATPTALTVAAGAADGWLAAHACRPAAAAGILPAALLMLLLLRAVCQADRLAAAASCTCVLAAAGAPALSEAARGSHRGRVKLQLWVLVKLLSMC